MRSTHSTRGARRFTWRRGATLLDHHERFSGSWSVWHDVTLVRCVTRLERDILFLTEACLEKVTPILKQWLEKRSWKSWAVEYGIVDVAQGIWWDLRKLRLRLK